MCDPNPALDAAEDYCAIIPAHNAEAVIGDCLRAVLDAIPPPRAVIVFDDGSSDDTARIADALGARVIMGAGPPKGPAHGRNVAVRAADAEVVVFIDADVVIEPNAPNLLIRELSATPDTAAAFGSYGTHQAATNLAGRYANLRHHFFHQNGAGDAQTFWTGLGAVRRAAFLEAGGFDESQRLEDVELGMRLKERGYGIRLVHEALGTHLKNWTVKQLWRDDIFVRALYWSRLMSAGRGTATLNTAPRERVIAVLAHLIWLCVVAGFVQPAGFVAAAVLSVAFLAVNARFLGVLWRHGGWATALAGAGLHWAYYLYASGTFAAVLAAERLALLMSALAARLLPPGSVERR